MSKLLVATPKKLSIDGFAPYGKAILTPTGTPLKTGDVWDCWFGLGNLSPGEHSIGIVQTRPSTTYIKVMEREPKTEFLLPITGSVIQAVALPKDLSDPSQQSHA